MRAHYILTLSLFHVFVIATVNLGVFLEEGPVQVIGKQFKMSGASYATTCRILIGNVLDPPLPYTVFLFTGHQDLSSFSRCGT
jgi:hypothetical protein